MNPGALHCKHPLLVELLRHRLSRRVFLNVLIYLSVLGPPHWLDCFLPDDFVLVVVHWVWLILQHYPMLDNWHAMVPDFVVKPLANIFGLTVDIFSSVINNIFTQYCCDPADMFAWMAPYVDGFSVLNNFSTAVYGLCNPFFDPKFIHKMLNSVATRTLAAESSSDVAPCRLVYVGPPLPRALLDPAWSFLLGAPLQGTFPFHHPRHGLLAGYPFPLELWLLGDIIADPYVFVNVQAVKHVWTKSRKILWTQPGYRSPLGLVMADSLTLAASQYGRPLSSPGRLQVMALYRLHNSLRFEALRCGHPAMLEAHHKFGIHWDVDLLTPEVFSVYLVICLRCKLLYVGSTTLPCWTRYMHELRGARRHQHFYHRHSALHRLSHTQHLCRCGLHWSLIGVLYHLPPSTSVLRLHQLEFSVMRRFNRDRLLNSRVPHGVPWTCPISLTVVRQQMVSILSPHVSTSMSSTLSRLPLHQLVAKLLESRRVSVDPRHLLTIFLKLLYSLKRSHPTVLMFQRFLLARLRTIRLWLPSSLCLRVHHLTPDLACRLSAVLRQHLRRLRVHPTITQYYLSMLSLVRCTSSSLGNQLSNHIHCFDHSTYVDLISAAQRSPMLCPCRQFSSLCHPTHGHVLFRFKDCTAPLIVGNVTLPDTVLQLLQSNVKGILPMSQARCWQLLFPELRRWHHRLLGSFPGLCSQLLTDCHAALGALDPLHDRRAMAFETIVRLVRTIFHGLVIGPCDKDPGSLWCACPCLLQKLLFDTFLQSPKLGGFSTLSVVGDAPLAMSVAIHQANLQSHCSRSKLKAMANGDLSCVPYLYLLFKKKCFPTAATLAVRPITSHFHHCLSRWSGSIGRGLSTLVRMAAAKLIGLTKECFSMPDCVVWWQQLRQYAQQSTSSNLCLFEFDFSNMYYHINKSVLVTMVEQFLDTLVSLFRRRCVAISKSSSKLDRIGSGTGRYFVTLSFLQIMEYIRYELQGNHYARVGFIAYQQCVGVPMGGRCSAQLCSIFFMMRELQCHMSHSSLVSGFQFWRFRDNLPGVVDLDVCSLAFIENFFVTNYGLPVKLEQSGVILHSLEVTIFLCYSSMCGWNLEYYHRPLLYDSLYDGIYPATSRIPAKWSINRSIYLRTVVPNVLLKCCLYASSPFLVRLSIVNFLRGLYLFGFEFPDLRYRILKGCLRHQLPASLFSFLVSRRLKPLVCVCVY